MSMSTSVIGFKPPDETWRKMKCVFDACRQADMTPPQEVLDYFDGKPPDESGVEIGMNTLRECGAVKTFNAEMMNGLEVDLTKLPKDVKILRFVNHY